MITKIQQKLIDERVERGIKWLDKEVPDWKKKIVFKNLFMYDSKSCICGQVFGDYWSVKFSRKEHTHKGFNLSKRDGNSLDSQELWQALENTWKKRIREIRKSLKK